MESILLDYYFSLLEVFIILFVIGAVGIAVYWGMRRHWQNRLRTLEQRHSDDLAKHGSEHLQALHDHLQSVVAHEFVKGLDYISKKSAETLEGLEEEQNVLRDKQNRIVAKAQELTQHADNILDVFAPERDELQKELLSMRRLVEHVLLELYPYAQSKGVTLRPNLEDVEPTVLDRNLTSQALRNVIHNAIKYSHPGGVVEIDLSLEAGEEGAEKTICIEVKDTGKGIREEDRDKVFGLRRRANGLIEPGSGLGLYCAREAARRQGGDLILVSSSLNQGSVFKVTLPYSDD
jgi:signal transduction histidine kinase